MVVALLTVVILAFGAYLAIQVLRFTKPPTVSVTQPATAVINVDDTTTKYTLEGTSLPGATVSIATPGRDPLLVTAGSTGAWAAEVDLLRGRNQFDVSATDPDTGKHSRGDDPPVHHGAVPRHRGADADRRPAGRGHVVRERGDPGRGARDERHVGRGRSAKYVGPSGPPAGAGGADPGTTRRPRRR